MPKKFTPSQFDINAAAENAIRVIAAAQDAGAKTLAVAAAEAVKVVAATAAESAKTVEFRRTEDHDLLIRLEENMKGLKEDIRKLSDGSANQLADHDARLKKICDWQSSLVGENGLLANIPRNCHRITTLENTALEFRAQVKTWLIVGGCVIAIVTYLLDKVIIPALK